MSTVFISLLFTVSILVGLTVEAVKKILGDRKYPTNIIAGIVSIVLSVVVGIFYCILTSTPITAIIIIYLIALVFFSWLCAMLGYDKVVQTLTQIIKK